MSKVGKNNVVITGLTGHVGNVTIYQRNGQTVMRSCSSSINNPRTYRQQQSRLRFASLGALWKRMRKHFGGMFIKSKALQSDYNAFTSLNQGVGVYMTKGEKECDNVISLPVQISNGELEEIASNCVEHRLISSLDMKGLVIDETTTVQDLAHVLLQYDFRWGDELVFVACYQKEYEDISLKYDVSCKTDTLSLRFQDTRLLHQVVTPAFFQTVNGKLGTAVLEKGCFGYLHRRRVDQNSYKFSPLTLANNNEALIAYYTSKEQFLLAGNSYGKMTNRFADPYSEL